MLHLKCISGYAYITGRSFAEISLKAVRSTEAVGPELSVFRRHEIRGLLQDQDLER